MAGIPTIGQIQQAAAREFRVPLEAMTEPSHVPGAMLAERARPRQAAMMVAAFLTEHSYPRIGYFFGRRDHTTVLHACRALGRARRTDAALDRSMKRITREVLGL